MLSVKEIAEALGAEWHGDGTLMVNGAAEPASARTDQLAVALTKGFQAQLGQGAAKVALLPTGVDWTQFALEAAIQAPRGRLAMAQLTATLAPNPVPPGVHPTAVLHPTAEISEAAAIGAFVSIGAGASIGHGCQIAQGCRIGANVRLGQGCILHPNVVLGADGFSFVTTTPAHVEVARTSMGQEAPPQMDDPTWHKIHSLGGVVIGDNVEIGANSTVDAGTIRPTQIGNGTKIDNLVQVGHNAVIGDHVLLCAQAGVAGSTVVGDRTVIGGKAGLADNITVGADVVIGGGSVVLSNVPDGRVMLGYPAVKMTTHVESYKALRRLPRLLARLAGQKSGSQAPKD